MKQLEDKPLAWLYRKPENGRVYLHDILIYPYPCPLCVLDGWTEVPLYKKVQK